MTLRASIIVPVHNKLDTIEQVLHALANQSVSRETFEVIVVDDHSSNECRSLLRQLAKRFAIRLIERSNNVPSASATRNAGLHAAVGKRVLLLDADVVLQRDALSILFNEACAENDVVCIETYGSSVAESIWEMLGPFPNFISGEPSWQELEFLSDSRVAHALGPRRSFDQLPAPWTYFWTTAVWIDRDFVQRVGGFDARMTGKGSEDIELGYRLHRQSARFRLATGIKALHLPHPRDRAEQERFDRVHEREFLARYPEIEVEMLCAFDAGNANAALLAFRDLRPLWTPPPPAPMAKITVLNGIGSGPILLGQWTGPEITNALEAHGQLVQHTSLVGFCLPYVEGSFEAALLPDLRGFLPEAGQCRIIGEAHRVAQRVFVARWSRPLATANQLSEVAWRQFDRPYWERSQRVSRSLYDWSASLAQRVKTADPLRMLDILEVRPAPVTTHLGGPA